MTKNQTNENSGNYRFNRICFSSRHLSLNQILIFEYRISAFVASKTNSTIFTDYNASFELTATLFPNLTDLCYADVNRAREAIHNFNNGNKTCSIFLEKLNASYNILKYTIENYDTSMELIMRTLLFRLIAVYQQITSL